MKTISAIFILAVLFTGCEKPQNYKCTCTTTNKSLFGGSSVTTNTFSIYDKQKNAQKQCDSHASTGINIYSRTTCALH